MRDGTETQERILFRIPHATTILITDLTCSTAAALPLLFRPPFLVLFHFSFNFGFGILCPATLGCRQTLAPQTAHLTHSIRSIFLGRKVLQSSNRSWKKLWNSFQCSELTEAKMSYSQLMQDMTDEITVIGGTWDGSETREQASASVSRR